MTSYCSDNLKDIRLLLSKVDISAYSAPSQVLFGASMGQHVRHILEFYTCLFEQSSSGEVCYDLRKRDLKLERSPQAAIELMDSLIADLNLSEQNFPLLLVSNFNSTSEDRSVVETSFHRELAYCLEHSIHHQALIKVGLLGMNLLYLVEEDFGVAPSTIRSRAALTA
jgi:hypothetical protein